MRVQQRLIDLIQPVVEGLGYELVGVEFDGRQRLLRVYIDSPEGIGLDDCTRVSNQVSGMLDVEDPISGHYQLEISSPGLDRPLFTLAHYRRFEGELARLHLARAIEGRRRFKARLAGTDGDTVLVDDGGLVLRIPFEAIEKARLAPEF
jgi:ribosome maturation factor RimP